MGTLGQGLRSPVVNRQGLGHLMLPLPFVLAPVNQAGPWVPGAKATTTGGVRPS